MRVSDLKLKNTYITDNDVDVMKEVLKLVEDYAIEDDGDREKFIIESYKRIVDDFEKADII